MSLKRAIILILTIIFSNIVLADNLLGDFDSSGVIDLKDFISFAQSYGNNNLNHDIAPATKGTGVWTDIYSTSNPDGKVDLNDFMVFAQNFGKKNPVNTQIYNFPLTYKQSPADNPLKGFIPFAGTYTGANSFPHSMEFVYIPLKDIQTNFDVFDWTKLETKLSEIAGRGNQAVARIYLDYPNKAYGVPSFLSNITKHAYTDFSNGTKETSYSPDYENPDLRRALSNFIQAFGKKYDGDPRIGFIQTGIIGFWGEWHTYPHNEWMASITVMEEVLSTFENSFKTTMLLAREPKDGVNFSRKNLGFHDDSFAYNTLGNVDWYFLPKLTAANLTEVWKTRPIGGEVRPEVQKTMWDDITNIPVGQEYDKCVDAIHASWMINQGVYNGLNTVQYERAVKGAIRMGYELYISNSSIELSTESSISVNASIVNKGVAPFYYPWRFEFGIYDNSTGKLETYNTGWDVRTVLPGGTISSFKYNSGKIMTAGCNYKFLIRVVNPMVGGKDFKFANETQDKDIKGWITIGSLSI